MPTEPSEEEILDAVKTIVEATTTGASVFDYWPAALVQPGQSLNVGRGDDERVNAHFFSCFEQGHERFGDVPEKAERVEGKSYTRLCEWTLRWKYVRSYDADDPRASERAFGAEIQAVVDGLGLRPKLGDFAHVERHYELQVKSRTLPNYGDELAYTAEGSLEISLRQLVKP